MYQQLFNYGVVFTETADEYAHIEQEYKDACVRIEQLTTEILELREKRKTKNNVAAIDELESELANIQNNLLKPVDEVVLRSMLTDRSNEIVTKLESNFNDIVAELSFGNAGNILQWRFDNLIKYEYAAKWHQSLARIWSLPITEWQNNIDRLFDQMRAKVFNFAENYLIHASTSKQSNLVDAAQVEITAKMCTDEFDNILQSYKSVIEKVSTYTKIAV